MRWIIFVVLFALIEIYAFQAVKTVTRASWVYYLYFGLTVLVIGNFIYQWTQPTEGTVLSTARSYAFGFILTLVVAKLVLVLFLFGEDLWRFAMGILRKASQPDAEFHLASRRKFISQLALGAAAVPFASLLYGMYQGKYNYRVVRHTLFFEDLPKAFEGYKIAHISDIHSGSLESREEIVNAIEMINQLNPDLVLFTGDLVNNLASEMLPWMDVFDKIEAEDGVYSVLGNHDYGDYVNWKTAEAKQKNLTAVKKVHEKLGWNLLLNENTFIERGDDRVALIGVENWGIGGFKQAGDIDEATKGVPNSAFKIVMSHDPSHWKEKLKHDPRNFHLTLSGHTHGMQFGIEIPGFKWSPIQYRYENWAGIYDELDRYINVNRGFGYLGYPGRVGIWPEITLITLKGK